MTSPSSHQLPERSAAQITSDWRHWAVEHVLSSGLCETVDEVIAAADKLVNWCAYPRVENSKQKPDV